uniref:SSD domain-containing protein n=1 Tax=Globisporangium ultimum (strain ATCC 200006 / CBS 805.95 / DAOM BR144) TaxID=431595 RepID=K3WTQ3_GLOUD
MGAFFQLGKRCSRAPVRVSLAALVCSLVLCLGLVRMRVQTDPQELWVPPTSVAAQEQARFDALFHPFFRIQQLIFYVDDHDNANGPLAKACNTTDDLVQRKYLLKMAEIQSEIASAKMQSTAFPNVTLSLEDFCYRPIKDKGCLVTSPFQYWQANMSLLQSDPDIKLTTACQTTDPFLKEQSPCMDQNGIPVMRNVVFGGLTKDTCHENPDPCGEVTPQAKALMVTFLLRNNPENETYTTLVQEWEQKVFLEIAARASHVLSPAPLNPEIPLPSPPIFSEELAFDGMKLTYMAQRSIADSLVVQTSQNAFIVVTSYIVMFLYVSMSLGKWNDPIHSRFGVGITGILIVLLSLGISMGVCSALFQMEVTMITLEVVPFLVLAIGVDNMFILTNEFDRLKVLRGLSTTSMSSSRRNLEDENEQLQQVLGDTLSNVGPSILVAAVAECLAFVVGILTKIPALESFCAVAAVAVLADFVLQLTWFTSALVLDTKRVRARRYDLWPFVRQTVAFSPETQLKQQRRSLSSAGIGRSSTSSNSAGAIQTFVEKTYTPLLLKRSTKISVLVVAKLFVLLSLFGFRYLPLGLEQELAVPTDFYLHKYFETQTKLGEAGPIAYIVLEEGIDYTDGHVHADVNHLLDELSSLHEYIQLPIYSWLHTFNQWRQMRFFLKDKIDQGTCDCPVQPMDPFPYEQLNTTVSLYRSSNVTPNELFYPLVHTFTQISIDSACCKQYGLCGAQYEGDIVFTANSTTQKPDGIRGARLRFQVNAMKNQTMFINSYYYLHAVTQKWSQGRAASAFPYALYFVYYEQYTYIQGIAMQSVLLALAVVFVAVLVLMDNNVRLSVIVATCVWFMTVSQLGFLFLWNHVSSVSTSINAVSVVNLLACVGLGVEFCVHMAHQFAFSQRNRLGVTGTDHAKHALRSVGASIISGITLTKVCGIGVLAFAPSMLFRVYFFRMYMGIVIIGFFYGMAVLPVVLSMYGQRESRFAKNDLSRSFLLSEEQEDDEGGLFDAY